MKGKPMHPPRLVDLPPEWPHDLAPSIRSAVSASGHKLVALDDDPTGVQTVHDTAVLARWSIDDLTAELRDPRPVCFVLTNSRSLPERDAARLNQEIAANLVAASRATGVPVAVASRSDSTLRGHFPAETDALAAMLGPIDGVLLVPAFFEGGRYTIDDIHWVQTGAGLVPAAETEFARDPSFGYTASNLRAWVEEKTRGRIRADQVASIALGDLRQGGPERVASILASVQQQQPVVVNAASYRDLEVVALGVLRAEASGKRFLYRTAAGFVRVRAGLSQRALLSRAELVGAGAPQSLPGLVVVGSHVRRSGEQLAHLLAQPGIAPVEIDVPALLDARERDPAISSAQRQASAALARGVTPVIFTSRTVEQAADREAQLDISRSISAALVATVRGTTGQPGWIVGKGGITSSDIGTAALDVRRAIVLGQIAAGIPVWRLGPETRYPGLPYIVFPGNVGEVETLTVVVDTLRGM